MEYSVVIPVYNGGSTLEELCSRAVTTLTTLTNAFEIIFVDDFSSDESWEVLTQLKETHKEKIKLIRFAKNYGQNNAVMCGLLQSKGKYIITIDDDLQHSPEDIPLLINTLKEKQVDLVYGVPKNYKHKKGYRRYASQLWKAGSKKFGDAYGEGASFRVITREIVDKIVLHRQYFVYIDEILSWYTNVIDFVKVVYNKNEATKTSGYSGLKLLMLSFNLLVFYSSLPLKIMTYGGVTLSLFSFALGLKLIYKKMFIGIPIKGYTSLMVAVLFSTSVLLVCFGIIGQYLGRMYTVLNNKPVYSIRDKIL